MSAGKGDTPRPVNWEKYGNNYDEIFRKKPTCQKCGEKMQNNYIYGWECEQCNDGKDHYHDQ